jgi:pSer/pThr/pTyr-binding forkhead associated (FHA) protein
VSDELIIRWRGHERRFGPGTDVHVGRDPSCHVQVDNPNVSRTHVVIRHDGTGWVLLDQGSSQGVFRDGSSVRELQLGRREVVVLGSPGLGEEVELRIDMDSEDRTRVPGAVPSTPGPSSPDDVGTILPGSRRPGGALREDQVAGATQVPTNTLRVECAGMGHDLTPGDVYTVGRDPTANIVSSNPTVSRRHAVIRHDGTNWVIEDTESQGGMFVDDRRVSTVNLVGATAVWLGDPSAGERLVLVASGTRERGLVERAVQFSRPVGVKVVASAVAVLVLVVVGVVLLGGQSPFQRGSGELTSQQRDHLARATVRVVTPDGTGSGTIVDAQSGLVLTNAHVVAPGELGQALTLDALEQDRAPRYHTVQIWVSEGLDTFAEHRFQAEVLAVDGYLDLAVVRITQTQGGSLVTADHLRALADVPMANSDELRTGDAVFIFGFPTLAQTGAVTLTQGVVSSPVQDLRLQTDRAWFNLDAVIRPGNSGGLVADAAGRVVGVPTLYRFQDRVQPVSVIRPVNLAKPLVDAARADEPYVSPHVQPLSGEEEIVDFSWGQAADGFHRTCGEGRAPGRGATQLSLVLDHAGFPDQRHQDLAVVIREGDDSDGAVIGFAATAHVWPFPIRGSGCFSVGIPLDRPLRAGVYSVWVYLGPNHAYKGDSVAFQIE